MTRRVPWLTDLVRLEILLWERIDARLRADHDLTLAGFEVLFSLEAGPLRIGELAARLRVTVGGTSKLADRVEGRGWIARTADPADRRVSVVALTDAGRALLDEATGTYEEELGALLDATLTEDEQAGLHGMVRRLLTAHE